MKRQNSDSCQICTIVFLSFAILTFFSPSTSWLFGNTQTFDSNMFQVIGKYWASGEALPYRDLWDLKGPIIFFVNALGYWLTGSKIGVFFIQLVSLSLSSVIAMRMLRWGGYKNRVATALSLLVPIAFITKESDGNTVSEYGVPLQMLSVWFVCKFFCDNDKSKRLPRSYPFVWGLLAGWCLMSRLTDFVVVGPLLLVVFVVLVVGCHWRSLLGGIVWFLVGVAMVVAPFAIYFGVRGLEHELWYGTLFYSLEYASNSYVFRFGSPYAMASFVKDYLPMFIMLPVSVWLLSVRGHRTEGFAWLLSSGVSLVWFFFSRRSPMYAMVVLPYIPVSLLVIAKINMLSGVPLSKFSRNFVVLLAVIIVLASSKDVFDHRQNLIGKAPEYPQSVITKLRSAIPVCDRDKFIAYNAWSADVYAYSGMEPCYPYFVLQDFEAGLGHSLTPRIYDAFASLRAKWILDYGGDNEVIRPILKRYYYPVRVIGGAILWKRER